MSTSTIRYELPSEAFRSSFVPYDPWISTILACPPAERVYLAIGFSLDNVFLPKLFSETTVTGRGPCPAPHAPVPRHWEVAPGEAPILNLSQRTRRAARPIVDEHQWIAELCNLPVALWFEGMDHPVISVQIQHLTFEFGGSPALDTANLVLARRDALPATLHLLQALKPQKPHGKHVFVANGPEIYIKPSSGWDSIVLDSSIDRLVRADFESFLARRDWFTSKNIPYRRGYLLHGPPGNGKTSVVRAMALHPAVSVTTLAWGDRELNDSCLTRLFATAAESGPTIVVMEDLDRNFNYSDPSQRQHNISLAHLLGCLDGIGTADGVIVVATANHPRSLDPAILSRPGRFDRIVEFPLPTPAMRSQYICRQFACTIDIARNAVQLSQCFSFAQLREAYILAGQDAYSRGDEPQVQDFETAVRELRSAGLQPNESASKESWL